MDECIHVYCTDCVRGEKLIDTLWWWNHNGQNIPKECEGCFPFDPEDSSPFYMRKNYIKKSEINNEKIYDQ